MGIKSKTSNYESYQDFEVCVFKPTNIDDSKAITDNILNGKAVILNLEGCHVEVSQRIIDFLSGACYAIDGTLQKISNHIFVLTAHEVDVSGDVMGQFKKNCQHEQLER